MESYTNIDVCTAIWHAFSALDEQKTGLVTKSKLKVFTASIGTLMGCKKVEEGLKDYLETSDLNFDQYLLFITKELLTITPGTLDIKDLRKYQEQLEELSWLVCRKNILKRDFVYLSDNSVYQLFRIFCLLGQLIKVDENSSEVVMVADEVEHVMKTFVKALGRENWDSSDFSQIAQVLPTFRFSIFLALLETRYTKNVESAGLVEATSEIYDFFVNDVLKKGVLQKKVPVVGKMRERWFVLQPTILTYYSSRDENDKKGEILINQKSTVMSISESNSKNHLIQVISGDKKIELGTFDYKTKMQWIHFLELAIRESNSQLSYQKSLAIKRRVERESVLQKKMEEDRKDEKLKIQLKEHQEQIDEHLKSKSEAEEKLKIEIKLREEQENKCATLEKKKLELEKNLIQEKQATKDEEIVRALQARMLNEEWEKREELENKLKEQIKVLNQENSKYQKLKDDFEKQSAALSLSQNSLKNLENDKISLERQLKETKEKATVAERAKDILEAKLKVRERNLQVNTNGQLLNNNNAKNIYYS